MLCHVVYIHAAAILTNQLLLLCGVDNVAVPWLFHFSVRTYYLLQSMSCALVLLQRLVFDKSMYYVVYVVLHRLLYFRTQSTLHSIVYTYKDRGIATTTERWDSAKTHRLD